MEFTPIPEEDEAIAREVIGAAIEVHRLLGPGFLESVYEEALCHELRLRSVPYERQKELVVNFKTHLIRQQRCDLLVRGRVIVELKSVETFAPIHLAKCLSYLKTLDLRLALLINFSSLRLKDGIKRVVH